MTESETAKAIFAYNNKREKRIEFCGIQVMVVAPPIGAMKSLLGALNGNTAADIDALQKNGLALAANLTERFPDIAISCVREAANHRIHVFQDDDETRAMLKDIPYDEALKIVAAASELMALDKNAVAVEVKNS